ncbi:MAG TPA: hypothetical protein VKV28_08535 [Candidatus Binataceae bacterium]|nr:hypothetical protein [Candidatus Binataceae bacterium]
MVLGLSHGGSTIFTNPTPADEVLVATLDGLVRLKRDRAGAWSIAQRALEGAHVSSLIMPEPDLMLAGIFKGGIVASRDDGRTWERRDHGLSLNDVYSLAATRLGGHLRLYAGTEPAAFFISDDLGQNWREAPALRQVPGTEKWTFPAPPHIAHVKFISVAPDDPATVYACVEQGGMARSQDGGESWSVLSGFHDDVHRMLIHPYHPNRLMMVTGFGIFISEDRGESWQQRTRDGSSSAVGDYPDQLVFSPTRPELMFLSGTKTKPSRWLKERFAGARILRTRDGGHNWEILTNGLPAPDKWQASIEAMCLEECGKAIALYAATTAGEVYASQDSGESWRLIAQGLAPISKGAHYRPLVQAA